MHRRIAILADLIQIRLQINQIIYKLLVLFLNCVVKRAVGMPVQDSYVRRSVSVVETQQLVQFTSLDTIEQF
jgi:hypothetical protein